MEWERLGERRGGESGGSVDVTISSPLTDFDRRGDLGAPSPSFLNRFEIRLRKDSFSDMLMYW